MRGPFQTISFSSQRPVSGGVLFLIILLSALNGWARPSGSVSLMRPSFVKPLRWGVPTAPIVVREYSSPTCHICGIFSKHVLPPFEDKYIRTGAVRLEVYCLPYNKIDLKIAMLIYQMPDPKAFYLFLLQNQELWLDKKDPLRAAIHLARGFRMNPRDIERAFKNPRIEEGLIRQRIACEQEGPINGLPVFKIGKADIQGLLPWEDFDAIIQKAQAHLKKEGSLETFKVKNGKK